MNATTKVETRVVPVTLNGETKNISIQRWGSSSVWRTNVMQDRASRPQVAYRYPTSKKVHVTSWYMVSKSQDGEWTISVPAQNGRGKYCRIIGWATDEMRACRYVPVIG